MKWSRGFTALELMVAISISALLLAVIFPIYESASKKESYKQVNSDAKLLLESMNQYYHRHCTDSPFPPVSQQLLFREGILVGSQLNNALGGDYSLLIDGIGSYNPIFTVSTSFNKSVDAIRVVGYSNNTKLSGNTVTWHSASSHNKTAGGVSRQLDRSYFGDKRC